MHSGPTLYLKLFGKPCFCFQTEDGHTPLTPLPTPLWAMLLAYLTTCEGQEASLETLIQIWNTTWNENQKELPVYNETDKNSSEQIAKSALATAIANARHELVKLCDNALQNQVNGTSVSLITGYYFIPNAKEQSVYLSAQTVKSDVARFLQILKEIKQLQNVPEHQKHLSHLFQEAKSLYVGSFIEDGDRYFGRANSRHKENVNGRVLRPWIIRTREAFAVHFEQINYRSRDSTRFIFKSLPTSLDGYVRRGELSERLHAWLLGSGEFAEQPLLLLHGTGGSGKTRLAIESVRCLYEAALSLYYNRIHFVSFASSRGVTSVYGFAQALSRAMDAPEGISNAPSDEISGIFRTWIAEGPLHLLVLDNLESVTMGNEEIGAWLIETMRHTNGRVRCLVTSQHCFAPRLAHYAIEGMELPFTADDADFDAYSGTSLFVKRVRETVRHKDYKLTYRVRKPLLELFTIVSGLPLGIEILAGRCADMLPSQIQDTVTVLKGKRRLKFLEDRNDLLREAPRHHGMYACISWTWELLSAIEQQLVVRLGVFPDDFTTEAAQDICEIEEEKLRSWAALALVRWDGTRKRWSLLPLISEFLREKLHKLPESTRFILAYCHYYLRNLEEEVPKLRTPHFHDAADRMDEDLHNFVSAQEYCLETLPPKNEELVLRFATALTTYRSTNIRNSRQTAVEELQTALNYAQAASSADAYRKAIVCLITINDDFFISSEHISALFTELQHLCFQKGVYSPEELRALALGSLDFEYKVATLKSVIATYEERGEIADKILTLSFLAAAYERNEKRQEALYVYADTLPEAIAQGWYGASLMASNMAYCAAQIRQEALAEKMFRRSLELCHQNTSTVTASWVIFNYAMQRERLSDLQQAARLLGYAKRTRYLADGKPNSFSLEEKAFIQRLTQAYGKPAVEREGKSASNCDLQTVIEQVLLTPMQFAHKHDFL